MTNDCGTSFVAIWQWISPNYKEGTVSGSRHEEYCSSLDEAKKYLEEQRKNPPMKYMKMHYLIQEETIKVIDKGIMKPV